MLEFTGQLSWQFYQNGLIKEILKRYLGLKFILMNCKFCKIGIY